MTLARSVRQYLGVRAKNPPNVQLALINPTSQNDFIKGDLWLNTVLDTAFMWSGDTWIAMGSGATGGVVTVTASSGGPLSPGGGNISIVGTANQITTAGAGSTVTLTLPAAITAPGSLTTTTTLAAGTTVTAGTDLVSTAGNVLIQGAAKQLRVEGGAATDFIGSATLVAGTVTIANTNIAATDRVFVSRSALNASPALGNLIYTINAGVSFTVASFSDVGVAVATDVSSFTYFIVRQL